jgi:hypothetical protein
MRPLLLLVTATLFGANTLAAQTDEPESFSEAEVYQALSWGMPEAEARKLAKVMSDDPADRLGLQADLPPGETAHGHIYSEDLLVLLSLVSEETNRKVEQWLMQMRLNQQLSPDERARWDKRRAEIRSELIKAGKLRDR